VLVAEDPDTARLAGEKEKSVPYGYGVATARLTGPVNGPEAPETVTLRLIVEGVPVVESLIESDVALAVR